MWGMQPPGALGTLAVVEGELEEGLSGVLDGADEGVTPDDIVVGDVVVVLVDLVLPPHPAAKTTTAAPPNRATAVLA